MNPIVQHGAMIEITYLTPKRFAAKPQIGIPIVQEWQSLRAWLSMPSFAGDKRAAGAWCPSALPGGVVKDGRGQVSFLVADVDDCGPGAMARSVEELGHYLGVVVPTFSATPEHEKHRIVLVPSRPFTSDEFPIAWVKMAKSLARAGIALDRGCKNPNRLYFACVARSPGAWLGARKLAGEPVPVDAMLAAARVDRAAEERERANRPKLAPVAHRDRYIAGALTRARANVAGASEGERHGALLREAFSLARLGLSEDEIADALLESFVAIAGESRRREGERAIRDAVAARRAA